MVKKVVVIHRTFFHDALTRTPKEELVRLSDEYEDGKPVHEFSYEYTPEEAETPPWGIDPAIAVEFLNH